MVSARTVHKLVMKCRRRRALLQGYRSYLDLRIPLYIFESNPPQFTPPGKEGVFKGLWVEKLANGLEKVTSIGKSYSIKEPAPSDKIFHVQQFNNHYKFWRAVTRIYGPDMELIETVPVSPTLVNAYIDLNRWLDDNIKFCSADFPELYEAIHRGLSRVTLFSKGPYIKNITSTHITISYGVRYKMYKEEKKFCKELAKVINLAKKYDVELRILKKSREEVVA